MKKEDLEEIAKLMESIERVATNAQDLARSSMDQEPGQRSQNIYWRYVIQDLRDIKDIIFKEEKE